MKAFDRQHARMLDLINYKQVVNESDNTRNSIEDSRIAANGKSYAIIRENSKFYIKTADAEKQNLVEAYEYIGGITEKSKHEYSSYAKAQKDFGMIMMALNEDHGKKVDEPEKKWDYVLEATDNMKKELSRQRQLMENCCKIGSYDCQCDPERVSGSNDADKPYTETGKATLHTDMPKATGKPASESKPYGDGKTSEKGKDVKDSDVPSEGKAVAASHPSGGKVARVNESSAAAGSDTDINGARDWNKGFSGNGNPKDPSLFVDGAKSVNEDNCEWGSVGLPSSAGVGEADSDHNNLPFSNGVVAEGAENFDGDEDVPEITDDEEPINTDDLVSDEDDEVSMDDEPSMDTEELPVEDEPATETEEEPAEDEFDFDDEDDDLESRLNELEAEIASIKAELGLDSDEDAAEDEFDVEDEPSEEPVDGFGDEEEPISDSESDFDSEDNEDYSDVEPEEFDAEDEEGFEDDEDLDECGSKCCISESKKKVLDRIVESIVGQVINEEKTVLHDFGKHPGYRKKPMQLPQTGTDHDINGARDWNDDSVHSEQPFGSSIGDGKPFDQAVKMITDNIMEGFKKKM